MMNEGSQNTLLTIYNRLAEAKMGTVLAAAPQPQFRPFGTNFLKIEEQSAGFHVLIAGPRQHRALWTKMAARALEGIGNVTVTDTGLPRLNAGPTTPAL